MPQYRLKFVKKIEYVDPILGRTAFRLINLISGEDIPYYNRYLVEKLRTKNSPADSIKAWADDLAIFFDYFIAATDFAEKNTSEFKASPLSDIIFAYPLYLVEATNSSNLISRELAQKTGFTGCSRSTASRRLSTIRTFLTSSVERHYAQQELKTLGLISIDVSPEVFGTELLKHKKVDHIQRQRLLQNSFLAGVISGGPQYVTSTFFKLPNSAGKESDSHKGKDVEKAFPCNMLIELLDNATCYRDRALWALLAGTGIRTHEALNLTEDDINGITGEVLILPYPERVEVYDNLNIKNKEAKKNKGRSGAETFFIEPFKEIFLTSLRKYLRYERPQCEHKYVFVALSNNAIGRPLYQGDATPHNKPFKKAQNAMGMHKIHTLHSLRHFYGTWVLNFLPTEHGYGLNIETVKIMMGHSSSATTERYAVKDKLLIRAQIKAFNQYFKENGFTLEQVEMKAVEHFHSQAISA